MTAWRFARWLVPGPLRNAARRWLRGTVGRIVLWASRRRRPAPPPPELAELAETLERETQAARRGMVRALADLERATRLAPGTVTRVVVTGDDGTARALEALAHDLSGRAREVAAGAPDATEVIVWERGV